jgi:chromosome partitioning protein
LVWGLILAHILSVASHKGGTGKTSTAHNIAAYWAHQGRKVLLVDLDPQGCLTSCCGVTEFEWTSYHALHGQEGTPSAIYETLALIPASTDLAGAELEVEDPTALKKALAPFVDRCDLVVLDCPPSLGRLTIAALTASTHVLIPTEAEFLPVMGLARITELVDIVKSSSNPELQVLGIALSRFDQRKKLHRELAGLVETQYPGLLFKAFVRSSVTVPEAQTVSTDVFAYAIRSAAALDFAALAEEAAKRLGLGRKKSLLTELTKSRQAKTKATAK